MCARTVGTPRDRETQMACVQLVASAKTMLRHSAGMGGLLSRIIPTRYFTWGSCDFWTVTYMRRASGSAKHMDNIGMLVRTAETRDLAAPSIAGCHSALCHVRRHPCQCPFASSVARCRRHREIGRGVCRQRAAPCRTLTSASTRSSCPRPGLMGLFFGWSDNIGCTIGEIAVDGGISDALNGWTVNTNEVEENEHGNE